VSSFVQFISSANAPAWVQAIGAIIALVVAICVPNSLHRKEVARANTERRLRTRALAVAIYPDLLEIEAKLERVLGIITTQLVTGMGSQVQIQLNQMKIEIPSILRGSLDNLYMLGEPAGVTLMQLIAISEQYERMREKSTMGIVPGAKLDPSDIKKNLQPHLDTMRRLAAEAEQALQPIHDETTSAR
jgi:hypothetical protein